MSYDIQKMNIIFYDGDCGLCNHFVKFVLRFEKENLFYFSPLNSKLALSTLNEQNLDTVVLLKNGDEFHRSDAALLILKEMKFPISCCYLLRLIPRFLRDSVYKVIARNRSHFLQGDKQCLLPTIDQRSRFI
ncbi:DCC1-like thiol-disulfide oxidoreductase family protein [Halobacteriovorax sp. JY17]|uniref:thiol-disulfide oxidoreductase DCC family protein n=1 Tax=Halobacteriovorax sp. JY17 TaxID=2014617 RepID=UPI000C461083|nr:DCC1-like thiol-disulfide oxidoreductase family protein [Halobacteriovorax sp. JY17]PIK13652.1 MAG: hypothetical protein CES88_15795 [Halobacteriovorax sp. JY17]